jgi:hypothetical protein
MSLVPATPAMNILFCFIPTDRHIYSSLYSVMSSVLVSLKKGLIPRWNRYMHEDKEDNYCTILKTAMDDF